MTYVTRWELQSWIPPASNPLLDWMPSTFAFKPAAKVAIPPTDDNFIARVKAEVDAVTSVMESRMLTGLYTAGPDFYWVPTPEEAFDNEKARGFAIARCLMVAVGADPFGWGDEDEEESEEW